MKKQQGDIILSFWGVRGSNPQCGADYIQVGGHTSCVSLETKGQLLIIDAGTGIADLGSYVCKKNYKCAYLLFSHAHFDHMIGLPFFGPLWCHDFQLTIISGAMKRFGGINNVLGSFIQPPYFPVPWGNVPCEIICQDVPIKSSFNLKDDISIKTFALDHPGGGSGYRIESQGIAVAYISDTAHKHNEVWQELVDFIRDVDVFIYDATFTEEEFAEKPHWGHSTWNQGVKIALEANAKALYLYHHEYSHTDTFLFEIEKEAQKIFPNTFLAKQGMSITL